MKIKTKDLTGAALDWAVAKCEGANVTLDTSLKHFPILVFNGDEIDVDDFYAGYAPSTDWAQGGPIIERERISIRQWTNVPIVHAYMPQDDAPWASDGTSPLIAAMRCYCSSKLGDEVDVPEELM